MGTMMSITSGKNGYDPYSYPQENVFFGQNERIERILRREDELRNSEETQREYSRMDVSNYLEHVKAVNIDIQMQVLSYFTKKVTFLRIIQFGCIFLFKPARLYTGDTTCPDLADLLELVIRFHWTCRCISVMESWGISKKSHWDISKREIVLSVIDPSSFFLPLILLISSSCSHFLLQVLLGMSVS
jgi:hypothetical protein